MTSLYLFDIQGLFSAPLAGSIHLVLFRATYVYLAPLTLGGLGPVGGGGGGWGKKTRY